jgi:hypothetical protein
VGKKRSPELNSVNIYLHMAVHLDTSLSTAGLILALVLVPRISLGVVDHIFRQSVSRVVQVNVL